MAKNKYESLNFENAINRLEELTTSLENDNLSLDESLKLFEEGVKLSKFCENKLKNVEQQITVIENSDYMEQAELPEENQNNTSDTKKQKKQKKDSSDDSNDNFLF